MTAHDLPAFVCASANPDKVAEIELILRDLCQLLPRPADVPDVVEDAPTLEGNARLKAAAIAAATGQPAIADDTGLEIDALGGAPGVRSARYSNPDGEENAPYADNVAKVLDELRDVAEGHRSARFRTAAIAVFPDGSERLAFGTVEGRIALAPTGEGGFGYDPIFVPVEGDGSSFAQMGDEKHRISHRGRAFRALARLLATDV